MIGKVVIAFSVFVTLAFSRCSDQTAERPVDTVALIQDTTTLPHDTVAKRVLMPDTSIIRFFSEFPPEIDGCSVIYSTDQQNYEARHFIYMNNYDSISFMNIRGEMIRFTLIRTEKPEQNTRELYFTSEKFDLQIEETFGDRIGDEVWSNYGTLILTDQNGNKTAIRFVGESGC